MNEPWRILLDIPWVLGLAALLATWSQATYTAALEKRPLRKKLGEPGYILAMDTGMLLVAVGLALTETRTWAQVVWGLIIIALIVEIVLRSKGTNSES
ncbi:MAG: hypothetical protein JXA21_15960 [Anaerolineae bacterium]|nr:hypothetical protein [Anaerolineae bacterium]